MKEIKWRYAEPRAVVESRNQNTPIPSYKFNAEVQTIFGHYIVGKDLPTREAAQECAERVVSDLKNKIQELIEKEMSSKYKLFKE